MATGPSSSPGPAGRAAAEERSAEAAGERMAAEGMPGTRVSSTNGKKAEAKRRPEGPFRFVRELPFLLAVAFLLALLLKTFVVQAFYIPSLSMEPTLEVGDRVLVNKVVYRFHPPRRGDVIVFEDPFPDEVDEQGPLSALWRWLTEGIGVSSNPEKDFIKRVVGLPGETVRIDEDGVLQIDGEEVAEPYLTDTEDVRPYGPVTVPEGSLFVMGDNRLNSNDSRFGLGFIPLDKVVGRAFVVVWPPSRIGWLH